MSTEYQAPMGSGEEDDDAFSRGPLTVETYAHSRSSERERGAPSETAGRPMPIPVEPPLLAEVATPSILTTTTALA